MTTKTLTWAKSATTINDRSGDPVAEVFGGNVMTLAEHWPENLVTSTLIVPCGHHKGADPEPSADLLAQWSQDSWEPFNAVVERLVDIAAEQGVELVILPGAGGRLSDAICTVTWANSHPDIPLLIDPARWLTPSMMGDLSDHLIRSASLCLEIPNIWGVAHRSVQTNDEGHLIHAPSGEGLIGEDSLDRTIRTIPSKRRIECL